MELIFIVAAAQNGVIGKDDDLPWRLSSDLRRFKALTTGHAVLAGRKTHASILARLKKPLPGRKTLVISRDPEAPTRFAHPDVTVFSTVDAALTHAREAGLDEVYVIGGASIYEALLHRADRIELTEVHADVDGDTTMPPLPRADAGGPWREVARERHPADERNDHDYSFVTLVRDQVSGD